MIIPSNDDFLTVTELNSLASQALAEQFGLVWIRAEIGSCTRASSGHFYLTLKDASSSVKAVMFRARAAACEIDPEVGDAVLVQARVGLYEPRGDFQLNIQVMRPDGRGSLHEQFQRIRARLQAEGLFDPATKRPIPLYPRAIGVITSLAAAALHDVLTTLQRRAPHVPVIVYPAGVQGPQAPLQLRQALAKANQRMEVDVILLVRGGGSLEDLWAFNDESLARDVASSALPVICGVGHESDVSIADFAADLRAPTPTAAAELCCRSLADMAGLLQSAVQRLHQMMVRRLERWGQRVDQLSYGLISPSQRLATQGQVLSRLEARLQKIRPNLQKHRSQVDSLEVALRHAARRLLDARTHRFERALSRLEALSPKATLDRGFAIVRDEQGRLVRSVRSTNVGHALHIQVSDGVFDAEIRHIARSQNDLAST